MGIGFLCFFFLFCSSPLWIFLFLFSGDTFCWWTLKTTGRKTNHNHGYGRMMELNHNEELGQRPQDQGWEPWRIALRALRPRPWPPRISSQGLMVLVAMLCSSVLSTVLVLDLELAGGHDCRYKLRRRGSAAWAVGEDVYSRHAWTRGAAIIAPS